MNDPELAMKVITGQSTEELHKKRNLLKKELFNLRFQKTLGELKNTSRFALVRKGIARINTEINFRLKTGE